MIRHNELEKWFIKNGWTYTVNQETKTSETARKETVFERRLVFTKHSGDFYKTKTWARYEHVYRKVTDRWGSHQSNWYSFYCYGKNRFKVENNISYRQFTVDQIESALKVIGLDK